MTVSLIHGALRCKYRESVYIKLYGLRYARSCLVLSYLIATFLRLLCLAVSVVCGVVL